MKTNVVATKVVAGELMELNIGTRSGEKGGVKDDAWVFPLLHQVRWWNWHNHLGREYGQRSRSY